MAEQEQQESTTPVAEDPPSKVPLDPVRRWTFILLAVSALLLALYLRADRVTPYTSQARVNALVVPIAPQVAGTVTGVFVSNSQPVEAGQKLFQIDIDNYQLAVQTAEANYDAAMQSLGAAEATVEAARAQVTTANAMVTRSRQDANRMRNIREQDPGAISERRLESAEASLAASIGQKQTAEANVEKAIQSMGAEGTDNSRLLQAQAALDQARLNLDRATVSAPVDGVVTNVSVDKGNFAAAGAPQMTFIASASIWVQADYTENNLGHIDAGDEVEIVFDVLPGQVVKGRVREIGFGVAVDSAPLGSLPTINNDTDWLRSAQRYPVIIEFDLDGESGRDLLKVGSQASIVVYTGEHWLMNPLARLLIRLTSWLTFAY